VQAPAGRYGYVSNGDAEAAMAACYVTGAWTTLDAFHVEVRFLGFTHWVPIELPSALLMREPASPGVPAKDLTCPK
jgi:hypothetical protein